MKRDGKVSYVGLDMGGVVNVVGKEPKLSHPERRGWSLERVKEAVVDEDRKGRRGRRRGIWDGEVDKWRNIDRK